MSFEPNPTALAEARHRMAGDRAWTGEEVAVGREAGREVLSVYPATYFASLRPMSSWGTTTWRQEVVERRDVDVVTIDDVAGHYMHDRTSALLKVDTQGFDAEVLEGGRRTLADHVAVLQVEAAVGPTTYEGAPTLGDMVELIDRLEFDVTWIGPAALRPDGAVAEFDIVAQRRR